MAEMSVDVLIQIKKTGRYKHHTMEAWK